MTAWVMLSFTIRTLRPFDQQSDYKSTVEKSDTQLHSIDIAF
jgi:hypothetical protein